MGKSFRKFGTDELAKGLHKCVFIRYSPEKPHYSL